MDFQGTLPGWRSHWSPAALKKKHQSIGDRAFMQGFRMKAYSDADYLLPNFKKALDLGRHFEIPDPLPPDWITVMGVDLAGEKRPGNVLWTGALDPHHRKYPLEVKCLKASSPEVAKQIGNTVARYRPQIIVVENNAYQGALIEWMNAYPDKFPFACEIVPFQTGRNKADPALGVTGIDIEFMNGGWIVPRALNPRVNGHEMSCNCGPCRWCRETENYPNSAQIDTVMAMWFFREGCRMLRPENYVSDTVEMSLPPSPGMFVLPPEEAFLED